jgi:hypothetical protein
MENKDKIYFDDSTSTYVQGKTSVSVKDRKESSIWKPITIGSSSAIMFTSVSALVMRKLEDKIAEKLSNAENIPVEKEEGLEPSFEKAFAEARQQKGPHSAFTWKGNVYSTATKEEWEQIPESQKDEIIESIDPMELMAENTDENSSLNNDSVLDNQTIGLDEVNTTFEDDKDMVYENVEVSQDMNLATEDNLEASVVVIDEGNEDIDDDVHIVSDGEISDVEVMMLINGNENQDVFIVDVDNTEEYDVEAPLQDVFDISDNPVDVSNQYDYIDPNVSDHSDSMDMVDEYLT